MISLGLEHGVGSPAHYALLERWRAEVGDQLLDGYAALIGVARTTQDEETA